MHIAIDIDDTLADSLGGLITFHNEKYKTNLLKEDFHTCLYREVWGGTHEEEQVKLAHFFETDYFHGISPMENSPKVISSLAQDSHKFSLVTGRIYELESKTQNWAREHFGSIFKGVYHTNSYGSIGKRIKKSEVCLIKQIDLLIDDDPNHIADCINSKIPVVIYEMPWNKNLYKNVLRVRNWEEVPHVITKI